MQLLKALLPIKVLQRLLAPPTLVVLQDSLIYQNHRMVLLKKKLVYRIASLHRNRVIRKQALTNRIAKSPSLMGKLVRL